MKKYQSGSAHLVIIISLVLALIAALGWIFYQNFMQTDTTASQVSNYKECAVAPGSRIQESYPEVCVTKDGKSFTNPDQTAKDLTHEACTKHEKICFTYPESWSYTEASEQFGGVVGVVNKDENKLTSPDKKAILSISTGYGQLGGLCTLLENRSGYVQTIETHTAKVSFDKPQDRSTSDLYAVKVIVNTNTRKFVPGVLLSTSKVLTEIGRHEQCTTGYSDLFDQKNGSEGYSSMRFSTLPFFGLSAEYSAKEPAYDTYDEAKAALSTQTYKEAFDILMSVHYEP